MNHYCRIALFCCLLLAGCDHVRIDAPFGAQIAADRLARAVGRWTDEEHNVFEIHQAKSGQLVGGHLSWDDTSERFKSNSDILDVRTETGSEYLFVKDGETFGFFRVALESDDEILLYIPNPEFFRQAVNAGSLIGTIESKKDNDNFTVFLTTDDKFRKFLANPDWKSQYMKDSVVRYRRLPTPK